MPTNKELFNSKMDALASSINTKAGTTGAKGVDALKTAVDSIVTPSGNQDITTLASYDVAAKATARVSAEERLKVIPGNIKKDVTILGITGTLESGGGGAELNIKYGTILGADLSQLVISGSVPDNIVFKPDVATAGTINTNVATLPDTLNASGTVAVGTDIYMFGGYYGGTMTNNIFKFDTITKTTTTLSATLYQQLAYVAAAVVGNFIYLFGGLKSGGDYTSIVKYNISTGEISSTSKSLDTNAGHSSIGAAVVGTKVYLFGGKKYGTGALSKIQVYDTENNTITTLSTSLPYGANDIAAVAIGTNIYLFGGNNDSVSYKSVLVFDTTNNTISTLAAKLAATAYGIGAAKIGGKIYLFGGYSSSATVLNTIQCFDTSDDSISTMTATLPTGAYCIGTAAVGTDIYLCGGGLSGSPYALNTVNTYSTAFSLTENYIVVQTNSKTNLFNLIDEDNAVVKTGVTIVYRGNSSNIAEVEDAYLYQNGAWAQISGT